LQNRAAMNKQVILFVTTAMLGLGCAESTPPPDTVRSTSATQAGVPGGMWVDVAESTAKVIDVDRAARVVILQRSDGSRLSVQCGPSVKNFDQIKIGDYVSAALSTQLEIFVEPSGDRSADSSEAAIVSAPRGEKPGVLATTTTKVTAKIVKLDTANRKATLQFADGRTETYAVRPDVDMSSAHVGDSVVMRTTAVRSLVVIEP
jgi:hypothetical protein